MSRLLFFILGAGAATWYTHTHHNQSHWQGSWRQGHQQQERPWQYHDNNTNDSAVTTYTADDRASETADRRREEFQAKVAQIGDIALDTMLEVTEAIRAKLAAAREEREAHRQSVGRATTTLPGGRPGSNDPAVVNDRRV
ncbi:hypothetical protein BDV98DRAFT_607663 [Pterulicium gracile]|uniref:Uncharacterized protein n=1 Tax=Pterulicium gracile TaxID=1884261 RepID=A0A5C3Q8H4_9AGAR|nr:hypothetical protein BDV98DRAFT_607663 [Pterula gracilis]